MDNQKHPEEPREENWLDDILGPQDTPEEIGPDEAAANTAGLTDPANRELDLLLDEIKSEGWTDAPTTVIPQATQVVPQPEEPAVETPVEQTPAPAPRTDAPFRDEEFRDTFGEGKELEQVFETTPAPESAPVAENPPREPIPQTESKQKKTVPQKRRPKHKKGYGLLGIPHIIATGIWIIIAVLIGTSLGRVLWLLGSDVLAFDQTPKTVTITVEEDWAIEDISAQLQEAGLIRYPWLFELFANFTGKAEDIYPQTVTLNAPDSETGEIPGIIYDYNAILNQLDKPTTARKIVKVVIPEGFNCAEIFARLEEAGVCTVDELEAYAANGDLADFWFLEGVERGDRYCLEGYLFPDTYEFYVDDEPGNVLTKFLRAFDDRFTDKMHESLIQINETYAAMMRKQGRSESYIAEHKIGIREVVIIASMIERESPGPDESYTISSVIYNRLASKEFNLLQIDATVIYANMLVNGTTENLDYQIDDPHNTYKYYGLPSGPITNPGRDSLNAAMNPEDTKYYYYALYENSKEHGFFTNLKDFEKFLKENGYYD